MNKLIEIDELKKENKQLEQDLYIALNKIDKAIELINYYGIDKEHNDSSTLRSILKQFLEILGDKE